ncbi:N-acyl homoserine lactonase [Acrasis kona]|uniref:N-acyl homoserine lactonase n=1 Tax=Acrasis kona TaxID=1008807 RepID=A0AAW2ZHC6_9EUKA
MSKIDEVHLLCAGYCTHPECIIISTGKCQKIKIPNMFALLRHSERGYILFDTGYTGRFYEETRSFPYNVYAFVTPVYVDNHQTAVVQLRDMGILAHQITHIIVSHFHADHVSGLRDFPMAKIVCLKTEYDAVMKLRSSSSFTAVRHAFLPNLLPSDFEQRVIVVDDNLFNSPNPTGQYVQHLNSKYKPFDIGYDLFEDGSIIIVSLPGHTPGHLGCFATKPTGEKFFFIGDACWHSDSFRGTVKVDDIIPPNSLTALIHYHWDSYISTIKAIRQLYIDQLEGRMPEIGSLQIIPSHCPELFKKYKLKNTLKSKL